jgi:hypothetical protein
MQGDAEQLSWFDELPVKENPVDRRRSQVRRYEVTKRNITEIPLDWLSLRYGKLQRWIRTSPAPKAEWLTEYDLITDHLKARNLQQQVDGEQLSLDIELVKRESYVWIVEEKLRMHYQNKVRYAWVARTLDSLSLNEDRYETSLTAQYGNLAPGRSLDVRSSVENRVMKMLGRDGQFQMELSELESEIRPIERILQYKLTADQRQLVESKYFCREQPKDEVLIQKFHIGRQKYYTIKKQALLKIAYELRII